MNKALIFLLIISIAMLFGCTENKTIFIDPGTAYGGMFNKADGGFQVLDLVDPDTYVYVTDLNAGALHNVGYDGNGSLTVLHDGNYSLSTSLSYDAANNGAYGIKAFVNGVGKNNCYAHRDLTVGKTASTSFVCILPLHINDKIKIGIDDHANPVGDATLYSMNVVLHKIGN